MKNTHNASATAQGARTTWIAKEIHPNGVFAGCAVAWAILREKKDDRGTTCTRVDDRGLMTEADARLIARAVNSHARLVRALEHAVPLLEAQDRALQAQFGRADNPVLTEARAALALAKGAQ